MEVVSHGEARYLRHAACLNSLDDFVVHAELPLLKTLEHEVVSKFTVSCGVEQVCPPLLDPHASPSLRSLLRGLSVTPRRLCSGFCGIVFVALC